MRDRPHTGLTPSATACFIAHAVPTVTLYSFSDHAKRAWLGIGKVDLTSPKQNPRHVEARRGFLE